MTPNPKEDAVEEDVAKEEATAEHIRMAITIGKIAHSTQETQTIHTQEEDVEAEAMEAEAMEADAAGIIKVVDAETMNNTITEVVTMITTVTQMTVTTITDTTIGIKETTVHKAM